jgi:hypothetical protein
MFQQRHYAITPDAVTLRDIVLSGADPSTFRHVHGYWSRDDRRVFWGTRRVTKIDAATFQPFNDIWARDAGAVYTATGKPVKDADPTTFRALDAGLDEDTFLHPGRMPQGFGADRDRVWFHNATYPGAWQVKGADPATFVSMGYCYGRDGRHVYHEQKIVEGADPRSFRLYGSTGYAADHAAVFSRGRIVEGADAHTFALVHGAMSRDLHRYYSGARPATVEQYLQILELEAAHLQGHLTDVRSGAFDTIFAKVLKAVP